MRRVQLESISDLKQLLTYSLCASLLLACSNAPDSDSTLIFSGICDGSAAVRSGRDELLVAYDEANTIYAFSANGGSVLQSYPLNDLLDLSDDSEIDIEASVVHDGGIWWAGSHGRDSDADIAVNRELLFKAGIPSDSSGRLKLEDGPYNLGAVIADALDDLTDNDDFRTLAPKKGGINIEGMSVTPDGNFLIGMRSPLSEGRNGDATIVQLASKNGEFEFVDSYRLDLNNRGIRDLALSENGYLLIAGDVSGGGAFSIFEWKISGELTKLLDLPEGFNAESLVDMGSDWLILSDDGKVKRPHIDSDGKSTTCDRIFKNGTSTDQTNSVYFRGLIFSEG